MFRAITTVFPQTYPDGYPASLFPNLGPLLPFFTPEDISRFQITSADGLADLLKNQPPPAQVGISFDFLPVFLPGLGAAGSGLSGFEDEWPILEVQTNRREMIQLYFCNYFICFSFEDENINSDLTFAKTRCVSRLLQSLNDTLTWDMP